MLFLFITETIDSILKSTHNIYFKNKTISGSLHTVAQKATEFLPPYSNFEITL